MNENMKKQPPQAREAVSFSAQECANTPDSTTAGSGTQAPVARWDALKLSILHLATLGYHIINAGTIGGLVCVQARAGRSSITEITCPRHLYTQAVEAAVIACQQDHLRRKKAA